MSHVFAPAAPSLDRTAAIPLRWEIQGEDGARFQLRVAADFDTRASAYELARRVYEDAGYAPRGNPGEMLISPFDSLPHALTLLAEDEQDRAAATLTLNYDSIHGLPSDEIFVEEFFGFRLNGRRLAEVSRLALDPAAQRHSRALLACIFNFVVIHTRDVMRCTDLVVSVNPRHVDYYRRLLCFEVIGGERPCGRVLGAPAVPMRMDLARPALARAEAANGASDPSARHYARTLFPRFYAPADEARAARFLAAHHRPMSPGEAERFGIVPPDWRSKHVMAAC